MAKFPEAQERLFKNMFICRRCKHKIRTSPQKVIAKDVKCRKCGCTALRAKKKDKKA